MRSHIYPSNRRTAVFVTTASEPGSVLFGRHNVYLRHRRGQHHKRQARACGHSAATVIPQQPGLALRAV